MRLSIIAFFIILITLLFGCRSQEPILGYEKKSNINISAMLFSDQKVAKVYSNLDHYILIKKKQALNIMESADSCILTLFIGINHYDYFNDSFKVHITKEKYNNLNDTTIKAHITATIINEPTIKKGNNTIYFKLINHKYSFGIDSGEKIIRKHHPETLIFNQRSFFYSQETVEEMSVTENGVIIEKSIHNSRLPSYDDTVAKMLERGSELNKKYRAYPIIDNLPTLIVEKSPMPISFSSNVSTEDYLIARPNIYSYISNTIIPDKEFYLEIDYQKKKAIQCDSLYVFTSSEEENLIIYHPRSKELEELNDTLAHTFTVSILKLTSKANQNTPSSFEVKTKLMCKKSNDTILLSEEVKVFYVGQRITIKQ